MFGVSASGLSPILPLCLHRHEINSLVWVHESPDLWSQETTQPFSVHQSNYVLLCPQKWLTKEQLHVLLQNSSTQAGTKQTCAHLCSIQIISGQTQCKTISELKVLMGKLGRMEQFIQNFKLLNDRSSVFWNLKFGPKVTMGIQIRAFLTWGRHC